ncbi:MAG: response regulator [bacterium]
MANADKHTGGATIWVIDDEASLVDAVHILITDIGYDFRGFTSPVDALDALQTECPDLFIVDLNMPQMTGVELIQKLRAHDKAAAVPILVLTAMASEGSLLNAYKAGADDVVRKPFGVSELIVRINWQLAHKRQMMQLKRQNDDYQRLTALAQSLSQDESLPGVLRTLIDVLRATLPISRCLVYLVHAETGDLHRALPADPSRSEGSPHSVLDLRPLRDVADALAGRRPIHLENDATRKLLDTIGGGWPNAEEYSSAIYPMQLRGRLVGVLILLAESGGIGLGPRERAFASIAADHAAVAVHRAELFQTLREDHLRNDVANHQLQRAQDFLTSVIESSPDAIVAADRTGKIVLFNHAAETIVGWSKEEAIGMDVRKLYPPGGAERIMNLLRSDVFGGFGKIEPKRETLVDRHGNRVPVEISAAIVSAANDQGFATVGIFTDLRKRLQMEERLQEATESLERTQRAAVAAELAGAAAHELNQPLTSLLGYAELLRKIVDEDHDGSRAVDRIYTEARRIADIVRKIGRITEYKTKEYVGGTRIVDLDESSHAEEIVILGDDTPMPESSTREIQRPFPPNEEN